MDEMDALHRDVMRAAEHIVAVLQEPYHCPDCGHVAPWPEWVTRRKLLAAADRHEQAARGAKYDGLSSAVYSLALNRLVKEGKLREGGAHGLEVGRA